MRLPSLLIALSLCFCAEIFGKVRILTFHYNQAEFIELQQRCLDRFSLDDYELIVFNDASTEENEQKIQDTCNRLGVQCVRYEQEWHLTDPFNEVLGRWLRDPNLQDSRSFSLPHTGFENHPSVRHGHVVQYALDHYGYDHDDVVAIMDGDAFFIRPISLRKRCEQFPIFGMTRPLKRTDVRYLWLPFIAFEPSKLPNIHDLKFNVAPINDRLHDGGAQSYHYLAANPSVKHWKTEPVKSKDIRNLSELELRDKRYKPDEIWLIKNLPKGRSLELNIQNCVLHFREVSFVKQDHTERLQYLYEFMDRILKN